MLWFCVIFLGFCSFVQTNPIPIGLNLLNTDADSSLEVQPDPVETAKLISNDSHDPLYAYCSSDTSTNDLAENNPLSADDFSLRRRDTSVCRLRSTVLTPPKPLFVEPNRGPTLTEPSDELCPDVSKEKRVIPLTCAGPEVWVKLNGVSHLIFVGNCEVGELCSPYRISIPNNNEPI